MSFETLDALTLIFAWSLYAIASLGFLGLAMCIWAIIVRRHYHD